MPACFRAALLRVTLPQPAWLVQMQHLGERQPSSVCESGHAAYNSSQLLHLSKCVPIRALRSFPEASAKCSASSKHLQPSSFRDAALLKTLQKSSICGNHLQTSTDTAEEFHLWEPASTTPRRKWQLFRSGSAAHALRLYLLAIQLPTGSPAHSVMFA